MSFDLTPYHVGYAINTTLIGIVIGFYIYCIIWTLRNKDADDFRVAFFCIGTGLLLIFAAICIVSQIMALNNGYWTFWEFWAAKRGSMK